MTGKERARLKSLASTEDTIIHVGKSGITPAVVASVDTALAVFVREPALPPGRTVKTMRGQS